MAATQAGLPAVAAVALSLIICAGGSRFPAVALTTSGAPVTVAALSLIAMSLRHLLSSPTLQKNAGTDARTRHWASGLTDEVA